MDDKLVTAIRREREACARIVRNTAKMYTDDQEIKAVLVTLHQEIILRIDPDDDNISGWIDSGMDEENAQDVIL